MLVLAETATTMTDVVETLLSWVGVGVAWWVVWIIMLWLAVLVLRVPLRIGRSLELALGGAVMYVIMRCVVCVAVAFILGNIVNGPPVGGFQTAMAAIFGSNAKRPPDWVFEWFVAFPFVAALIGQSIARRAPAGAIQLTPAAQAAGQTGGTPGEELPIGFAKGSLVTLLIFVQVAVVEILIQWMIMPKLFPPAS